MIAVPDSVAFYWRDPVSEAALNVLGDAGDVPGDLSIAEAEQFTLAVLAAQRVRVEFWQLLHELRAAVWDQAVQAAFSGARLLSYGEHQAVADEVEPLADPSVDHAWAERAVAGIYQLRDGAHLFTGLRFSERDRVLSLELYHWSVDETTALTDELDLGADWSSDGEERRTTTAGLFATPRGSERIDPGAARAVAQAAAMGVAEHL